MDENNYIDLVSADRNKFIYRIISKERLFELFEKKQNVLVKPRKWDDPFENFILKSSFRLPTGELATISNQEQLYGQCWTLHSSSDAMWRIYSPDKNAIRIRTRVGLLAESLGKTRGSSSYIEAFVGKVRYLPNKRLIEFARNAFSSPETPWSKHFARTLLVKRPAFKHEREVRLILVCSDANHAESDLCPYSIDPYTLIDQMMIDPRLTESEANKLRSEIVARTSFKGSIKRSLLYAMPPSLVIQY